MLMKGLRIICFLGFMLPWKVWAFDCDISQVPVPNDLTGWSQLHDALAPHINECQNNGSFMALLGAAQLHSGYLKSALKTLERALMVDPAQGGARVDFARALYLDGQPFAALTLNQDLMREPNLPPQLQTHLADRQRAWRRSLTHWRHQLSLSAGWDNNLNSAPDLDFVTFTISGQALNLQLADQDKPKTGNTFRLFWGSRYEQQKVDGEQYVQASLNSRNTPSHDYDAHQLELRAGRRWQYRRSELDLSLSSQSLHYGGDFLYTGVETEAQWLYGQTGQSCHFGITTNLLHQRFPQDDTLDGNELRVGPLVNCRWQGVTLKGQLQHVENWAEHDNRVGGGRSGWNTQWSLGYPLGAGRLNANLSWAFLDDDSTYSPILAYGEPREVRQYAYSLQYLYPIGRRQAVTMNMQRRAQRSNVKLFEHTDTQFEVGILWIF